MAVLA